MFLKSFITPFKNITLARIIIVAVCALLMFYFSFKLADDPDLGWHIRTGEEIIKRQEIPAVDWFTHSLPNFKWVDHEWLTDTIIYLIYKAGGPFALSLISSLIIIYTFGFLLGKTMKENLSIDHQFFIGLLAVIVINEFIGVRPQILALLGTAFVLVIIKKLRINPQSKSIYLLPVLFLLWANIHASFALGLFVLVIIAVSEAVKTLFLEKGAIFKFIDKGFTLSKDALRKLAIIIPACILITLINPYSYRIYEEIARTLTDTYAHTHINEWMRPDFETTLGISFLAFASLIIIIFFIRKGRMDITYFAFFMIFFLLSLQSKRHIPIFITLSTPYLLESSKFFYENFIFKILRMKLIIIGLLAITIYLIFFKEKFQFTIKKSFHEDQIDASNPVKAVDYLRRNPIPGNMLNEYNWGGYMIKALPGVKVLCDGRTAHWKEDGKHLLRDFLDAANNERADEVIEAYQINFVFVESDRGIISYLQNKPEWKTVYSDDKAVIMKKR